MTKGGHTGGRKFTFDSSLNGSVTPERAYQICAADIVTGCLRDHLNGTIFAYGQTGTGKTFTMMHGAPSCYKGVIPLAFEDIFSHVAREGRPCRTEKEFSESKGARFLIQASYLEVYNEEVHDLLVTERSSGSLKLFEEKSGVW